MIREKDFVLRPYTKKELAMRFFPDTACPRTATAHLVRWIKRCTPLSRQLEACGYRRHRQMALGTRGETHRRISGRTLKTGRTEKNLAKLSDLSDLSDLSVLAVLVVCPPACEPCDVHAPFACHLEEGPCGDSASA